MVLGAQVRAGGLPSHTLAARVLHAAGLWREGAVRMIIPTGGIGEYPPSEAEVAAVILDQAGIPREAILLESKARNTRESALLVAELLIANGIRQVIVVTDPLHCIRTVSAFRDAGVEVVAAPVYKSPTWRMPRMRRAQFFREMGALIWYGIRRRSPR